jgi:tetratricopeptide (TPR) repeat protein
MIFRLHRQWLAISLSVISLCLTLATRPAPAILPSSTPAMVTAAPNWLESGRNFYRAGRFTEAVAAWQTAVQQAQGDRLNQALALSYLSLAQQELTQWEAAQHSIDQSLQLLKTAQPAADAILWAQTLNTQASLLLHTGKSEAALETWQQAQKYYEQAGDGQGSLGSQINQSQALQNLGFYRRSRQQLEALNQKLTGWPDSELKVSGLRALGTAMQTMGDTAQSQEILELGSIIARKINATKDLHAILLSLGKTAADLGDPDAARNYLQQVEHATENPIERLQARLVLLKLAVDAGKTDRIAALAEPIQQQLAALPASRSTLYGAINFVATLNQLDATIVPLPTLMQLLATTVQAAQQIQDAPAEAYALTQWGQLDHRTQQWAAARQVTQKALTIARQLQAEDIIAQAAWQLGRLAKQQGQRVAAIAHYSEAVTALQAIRGDLVAVNPDIQFSFRESVEPVYREMVDLLLDAQPSQAALIQARELIEALQVAELDNFFREACLDKARQIDQVDPPRWCIRSSCPIDWQSFFLPLANRCATLPPPNPKLRSNKR